jgi:hypothetical protein
LPSAISAGLLSAYRRAQAEPGGEIVAHEAHDAWPLLAAGDLAAFSR